jgi:hypothetical protein
MGEKIAQRFGTKVMAQVRLADKAGGPGDRLPCE